MLVRELCNIVFSHVPDLSYIIVAISLLSSSSVANNNSRSILFINQIIIKSLLLRGSSSSLSTIILFLLYQDRYYQDHPIKTRSLFPPWRSSYLHHCSHTTSSFRTFSIHFPITFSFHNVTLCISSVNRTQRWSRSRWDTFGRFVTK